ncbi:MAG TPA: c-type cytochrome [Steroidobacteraceae bacterium]|nr:c-type cytochrome [Steroidobacteraceae bacterium]
MQSTAHPAAGSGAALIHEFSLALYVGAALIFLLVMGLVLVAVFGRARPVDRRRWILGGGIAFPAVTLTVLLTCSLAVGTALSPEGGEGPVRFVLNCISSSARALGSAVGLGSPQPLRIDIVGRRWWWEVRYQDPDAGLRWVTLANELYLPTGRPAQVTLQAEDVIHSFWVPSLAGKVDMIPGRTNRLVLQADEPGVHRGQCAEFCGAQHALMALYVMVVPPAEFDAWLRRQAEPVTLPEDAMLRAGHDAFIKAGCAECHAVRGTVAAGDSAPDLTHVGGRRALGAGLLRNHIGTMAGWIADPQMLKPGNLMPQTRTLDGQELRALAQWLGSLQ